MVSQKFSKGIISNMDASSLQTEDLAYNLQFQPNIASRYFNPLEEQLSNNLETRKENPHNYGNGNGLSLTLGSRILNDFQNNGNMIYNSSNPSNQNVHGLTSTLSMLHNSRYMKPAQLLLDELVCVSNAVEYSADKQVRRSLEIKLDDGENIDLQNVNDYLSDEKHFVRVRINKLVALLDQLDSRYEQYFNQMETVVSSFEAVAGIGAASSYTALTIQAMSKHFSNLRDAIVIQINASKYSLSNDFSQNNRGQRRETLSQLGMMNIRQVWRPLRGLPEESVSKLRAWLFEHFLHPYPSDNEKLMLASQTGLTRNQISNWFINARVRLWKPMIEEMYREEFAEDMQD